MKYKIILVLILSLNCFSILAQDNRSITFLKNYEGLWIQIDFLKSFEKTKSIKDSKFLFAPELPVGIRINTSEMINNKLTIGYSVLHDHLLHPEVSHFTLINKDTVYEQGSITIDLSQDKNLKIVRIGYIPYFNTENTSSYLTYKVIDKDTLLVLYREQSSELNADSIYYKKTNLLFEGDYKYPNPIYYYARNRVLTGNYTLLNKNRQVICEDFKLSNNGLMKGYDSLKNKKVFYSTDIYCGLPLNFDLIKICSEPVESYFNNDCKPYVIVIKKNGDKYLYEYEWDEQKTIEFYNKNRLAYILMKNK